MPTVTRNHALTKQNLVAVRDTIENVKAVIDVACSAIRDMGGSDYDNVALVLTNHAYVPLKEIGQQLDAGSELSRD